MVILRVVYTLHCFVLNVTCIWLYWWSSLQVDGVDTKEDRTVVELHRDGVVVHLAEALLSSRDGVIITIISGVSSNREDSLELVLRVVEVERLVLQVCVNKYYRKNELLISWLTHLSDSHSKC